MGPLAVTGGVFIRRTESGSMSPPADDRGHEATIVIQARGGRGSIVAALLLLFGLSAGSSAAEKSGAVTGSRTPATAADHAVGTVAKPRSDGGKNGVPVRRTGDTTSRGTSASLRGTSAATVPLPPSTPPPPRPQSSKSSSASNPTSTRKPVKSGGAVPPRPVPEEPSKSLKPPPAPQPAIEAKRIRVRTESGKTVIARLHGEDNQGHISVILPDGQIRIASASAPSSPEPFRAATADEVQSELSEGPYAGFRVIRTKHYVVFSKASPRFTDASARLLDDLYTKLLEVLGKFGVPTHKAEFPLVAVIYATEKDFRANKKVARDVQACYEIFSNQIFLYESNENDGPEVAALRRPQTVAHEGTHQILANIGVQPRLSEWPMWLVEGLAEYCSPPVTQKTKKGRREVITWTGLGYVNPFHMATIKDLDEPLPPEFEAGNAPKIGRQPGTPLVEYIVTKEDLTPTDYALAWAVTHYLAMKRTPEFVEFLKDMGQMRPLEKRTPKDHLAEFRRAFGNDLVKLDKSIDNYLSNLPYKPLPFFSVVFEQPVGGRIIQRKAMVSQSPSKIQQWIESNISPNGGDPRWEVSPHPSRNSALYAIQQWIQNR